MVAEDERQRKEKELAEKKKPESVADGAQAQADATSDDPPTFRMDAADSVADAASPAKSKVQFDDRDARQGDTRGPFDPDDRIPGRVHSRSPDSEMGVDDGAKWP